MMDRRSFLLGRVARRGRDGGRGREARRPIINLTPRQWDLLVLAWTDLLLAVMAVYYWLVML